MKRVGYNRPAGGRGPKPYASGAGRANRTTVGDADYTVKSWDRIVVLTSNLTTDRTWTLPLPASVPPGYSITFIDQTGSISDTNTLTIRGVVASIEVDLLVLTEPFSVATVYSDGIGSWLADKRQANQYISHLTATDLTVEEDLTVDGNILGANLRDSTTEIYDNVDTTKRGKFQAAGISASTTRVYDFPDRSGVLVTEAQILQSSAALPFGYQTGAGGAVTQASSKTTAVTVNAPCGQITTNNAALAGGATAAFTVNNSVFSVRDAVLVTVSGSANYTAIATNAADGSFVIRLTNITAGSLSDAVVINFAATNVVIA